MCDFAVAGIAIELYLLQFAGASVGVSNGLLVDERCQAAPDVRARDRNLAADLLRAPVPAARPTGLLPSMFEPDKGRRCFRAFLPGQLLPRTLPTCRWRAAGSATPQC